MESDDTRPALFLLHGLSRYQTGLFASRIIPYSLQGVRKRCRLPPVFEEKFKKEASSSLFFFDTPVTWQCSAMLRMLSVTV